MSIFNIFKKIDYTGIENPTFEYIEHETGYRHEVRKGTIVRNVDTGEYGVIHTICLDQMPEQVRTYARFGERNVMLIFMVSELSGCLCVSPFTPSNENGDDYEVCGTRDEVERRLKRLRDRYPIAEHYDDVIKVLEGYVENEDWKSYLMYLCSKEIAEIKHRNDGLNAGEMENIKKDIEACEEMLKTFDHE